MHLAREIMFRTEVSGPLATLRPTLVYGALDTHNGYGPNRFRRLAERGEEIVLFGEGEERRDHVFIDDVVELVARVVLMRSRGTLNIATGKVHSFREIANAIIDLSGRDVSMRGSIRIGPMPHGGLRQFDISACRSAFPDFEYKELQEGFANAIEAERRIGDG